jgi:hypothetical protein
MRKTATHYTPISMVPKTDPITPAKKMTTSGGEARQKEYTVFGGVIRSPTAWMMTPARDALGM